MTRCDRGDAQKHDVVGGELGRNSRGHGAEVLALPQVSDGGSADEAELLPRARHVDGMRVVRVEQKNCNVAVGKRFVPHLRSRAVVERYAIACSCKRILIHSNHFSVGENFFAVAEETSYVAGDKERGRP